MFRLDAHVRRLYDSARIYRMDYEALGPDEFHAAILDTIRANRYNACYIRPLIYRGYDTLGVNPFSCPVEAAILVWEWGAYLGEDALEHRRRRPGQLLGPGGAEPVPFGGQVDRQLRNSQLIKMEPP